MSEPRKEEIKTNEKPDERYELVMGKFGVFFNDKIENRPVELANVLLILNISRIRLVYTDDKPKIEQEIKVTHAAKVDNND